ncbi:MAG: hypothetical protein CMJ78_00440 [Planctomycetaceae bacterium]|nr:hypothetical protein [Planctomycetaceae bacterium]
MMEQALGAGFIGLAVALGAYASQDYYVAGLDHVEADFRDKLRRLRANTKGLRTILKIWSWVVGGVFMVVWILAGSIVFGVTAAALLICLPWYLLKRMAEQRRLQIEDQLADAMVSLSSAIRAGLSLAQAMDILAQQCPQPISQEFQQMVGEYQLGKPLERCLSEAKERLKSENFALFAAAMEASRKSGGRLNQTVERIARSVRELQRLERKIVSETAQARASAFYMALAPFAVLAIYYFIIDPLATERLFTTFIGQLMLCFALILNLVAYLWARQILNPDI